MKKLLRRALFVFLGLLAALALLVTGLFVKQAVVDAHINDDIGAIYTGEAYRTPVSVAGIDVMQQKVSCGYACIELLARWQGLPITEDNLLAQNDGKITTAMGDGFQNEMNRQFPEFLTTKHTNLKNTELLDMVYHSLANGMPVPVEFAALYRDGDKSVWTLHFAIITAMDVGADEITISNPYGYKETYTLRDFLRATRYESYQNMEFYLKLGFAAGLFQKNTIYTLQAA